MKKTILLADADASVRENLARVLELEQYTVLSARSGSEAAEKLLTLSPDLALFDLELADEQEWPGLDSLCDTVPGVPIILITARSHQENRATQLGVDALMEKPLHLPLLLKTIRNLVRESKSERQRRLIDPGFKTLFLTLPDQAGTTLPTDWTCGTTLPDPAERLSF